MIYLKHNTLMGCTRVFISGIGCVDLFLKQFLKQKHTQTSAPIEVPPVLKNTCCRTFTKYVCPLYLNSNSPGELLHVSPANKMNNYNSIVDDSIHQCWRSVGIHKYCARGFSSRGIFCEECKHY